jgi:hypothetical protein
MWYCQFAGNFRSGTVQQNTLIRISYHLRNDKGHLCFVYGAGSQRVCQPAFRGNKITRCVGRSWRTTRDGNDVVKGSGDSIEVSYTAWEGISADKEAISEQMGVQCKHGREI